MINQLTIPTLIAALSCCQPIADEPPPPPAIEACAPTTWSSWGEIPTCDLDGSQTWILTDEATDLTHIADPRTDCQNMGGVFALEPYDPMTLYCIDIDY